MRNLRTDAQSAGSDRARWLSRRLGQELRIARVTAGLSQTQLARSAGVAQTVVSRTERGVEGTSLERLCRMAAGTGHEVSIRLFPVTTVRLRDSGQLAMAQALANAAHPQWQVLLEAPIGPEDRRAADMVFRGPDQWIHVEIERVLVDFQAQLRSAQLKRDALSARHGRAIQLVMVVADTGGNRDRVRFVADLVHRAMPARAHDIWAAIRTGRPLESDGILFVRVRRVGTHG